MGESTGDLSGRTVLVLEDECILALDLALIIEDEGAEVEGPIHRLDDALAMDWLHRLDAAIVDVDLSGQEVFEFADRLAAAEVPVVFHTGRPDIDRLRARYPGAGIVRKPSRTEEIVEALATVVANRRRTPHAAAS